VGIDELAVGQADRHRVDREVPSSQVGLDVLGEGHLGVTGVLCVGLLAERGDLDAVVALAGADRPEPDPHEVSGVGPALEERHDFLGTRVGGEVELLPRAPQDRVPNRTAHQVQLVAGGLEPRTEVRGDGRYLDEVVRGPRLLGGRGHGRRIP
jgi:hypothetical protein